MLFQNDYIDHIYIPLTFTKEPSYLLLTLSELIHYTIGRQIKINLMNGEVNIFITDESRVNVFMSLYKTVFGIHLVGHTGL